MSAGTIKLTNGSTAVVGTGTAFTLDLKSGDVITATVGGIFFTLFVDAVTSNTALTLTDPFTGPTTSGLAWVAVPQLALNRITAALAAQTAESVRRVLQENANWQAFYSGTGDITVTLPDGSPTGHPVTGPSWPKMSGLLTSAVQWRGRPAATENINTYGPTSAYIGQWGFGSSGTLMSNGFPEDGALGILEVFQGGRFNGCQRFISFSGNEYYRTLTAAWNGSDGPWDIWKPVGFSTMPGYFSGDMNTLLSPGIWSTTNAITNGPLISGGSNPTTGICEVILRNASNTVLQRYTNMSSSTATYNYTWQRTLYGTTWSPWELLGKKALNDVGIGVASNTVTSLDWQTFDFVPGALYVVSSGNMTNVPAGLDVPGTTYNTIIRVNGPEGTTRHVDVCYSTTSSANFRYYQVRVAGAAGSKTFTVRKIFNSNDVIPVANGGTGSSSPFGTTAGTFTQGNDSRLATVGGKSGGTISSPVDVAGALSVIGQSSSYGEMAFKYPSTLQKMTYAFCENYGDLVFVTTQAANAGTEKYFSMRGDKFTTPGNITCVSLTQTSDADKKADIKPIENALEKILSLDGVTFNWKDSGLPSAGVIAQQLIDILPEAVGAVFDDHNHYEEVEETEEVDEVDEEGSITKVSRIIKVNRLVKPLDETKRSYTVEYSGVVALCLQAIKELNAKVETLEKKLNPQEAEEQPDVQQ